MAASTNLLASVIIPVYNKEAFLPSCFETLTAQTLESSQFEAIFVDDGSRDNSLKLLEEFAATHPWAKIIAKENGGVCSARNAGIHAAKGKYLFYLDPDDSWSPNVLESVSVLFDKYYDKVDMFTYPIVPMSHGEELKKHFRYETLTSSGVYDLTQGDNWLVTQTTMNICVKNQFEKNHTFDFESENGVVYHEDQQYITEILLDNPVIGYCAGAQYIWNKNDDSVTNNVIMPYYVFNNTMNMYEHLYRLCNNKPPRFLQSLLVHDLGWKMTSNAALPEHLEGEAYDAALARLKALLQGVDDEIILRHPSMHLYHRYFFLQLKWGEESIRCVAGSGGLTLIHDDSVLYAESRVEVNLLRTRIIDGNFFMVGIVKSPTLPFITGDLELWVSSTSYGHVKTEKLELEDSSWDRLGTKSIVTKVYGFRYQVRMDTPSDLRFFLRVNDVEIPVRFTYIPGRVNFSAMGAQTFTQRGCQIVLKPGLGYLTVRPVSSKAEKKLRKAFGNIKSPKILASRQAVYTAQDALVKQGKRIWLYCDAQGRLDNGWYQFVHDCMLDDGITRYYVTHDKRPSLPKGAKHASIIKFGGRVHRFLYLLAEKVLCSDVARKCVMPWSEGRRRYYADFDNPELIYLQHGVLWAHMPWYYSYDRVLFDKEVISTQFERENLTGRYGFREEDLIDSGMPRYDTIRHDAPVSKKILLCPSWRSYLIGEIDETGNRPFNVDRFMNSHYFKGLNELLTNERLGKLLEDYGYELVFKLHPNFACYQECFTSANDRVTITSDRIDESEFALIITDYSSYSFDFVYLKRALIYYITDMEEFKAGVNNYNQLDMPLDDALGEYAQTSEEAIDAIERVLKNDGKPLDRYAAREDGFFLHYDNEQCERLYQALIGEGQAGS